MKISYLPYIVLELVAAEVQKMIFSGIFLGLRSNLTQLDTSDLHQIFQEGEITCYLGAVKISTF